MEWMLIGAGASVGIGLFNAVDEFIANRDEARSLGEIRGYLRNLDARVQELQRQATEILRKLDELPAKFGIIVDKAVGIHLLQEQYAKLENFEQDMVLLDMWDRYRVSKHGWVELSEALHYLFKYEGRVSKQLRLIQGCELAMFATREKALPRVAQWVEKKKTKLKDLERDLRGEIAAQLVSLKALLDNDDYVAQHNLGADLPKFEDISYEGVPNRSWVERYVADRACVLRGSLEGGERNVCTDIWAERHVPDGAFHSRRDTHLSKIEAAKERVKRGLEDLGALASVVAQYEKYLERLRSGGEPAIEMTVLHHPADAAAHMRGGDGRSQYFDSVPSDFPV